MTVCCQGVHYCIYLSFFLTGLITGQCYQFNQEFTGVAFTPYVKLPFDNGTYPDRSSYSFTEIRVMLETISDKFTKIITWGSGSINGTYIWNSTYYHSFAEVYIAEIAASINLYQNSKHLSMFQGIRVYDEPQMSTEVQLAVESTEKANNIFPGTVEGIVISDVDLLVNFTKRDMVIKYLKDLRISNVGSLKLGTRFDCDKIILNRTDIEQLRIITRILDNSDFIICLLSAQNIAMMKGPGKAFEEVVLAIEEIKKKMGEKPSTQLMGQVWWASPGENFWETVDNMKQYWEIAGEWAGDHHFLMWFYEAFDRYGGPDGNYGWWKLISNSKSDKREGYVEKYLEERGKSDPTVIHIVIGVVAALLIVGILLFFIVFLLLRLKKLRQVLSKEDIKEFLEGRTSIRGAYEDNDSNGDNKALEFPYDYSFEIAVNQLNIQHNHILGTGQFGCVYKATLSKDRSENEEVALKVAKPECPCIALKGLLSEIKILTYVGQHANIVKLIGAYTAEIHRGTVYVATELCSLGSLQDYIRQEAKMAKYINIYEKSPEYVRIVQNKRISYNQMLQWSWEIANGMEFLGTKNVVHADLASRNVLLTGCKTAKIADFGLSRRMYDYGNYIKTAQEPLPWRWMSIESLKWCEFSVRSDIWSYGVTLWEIFTLGDTPYPGLTWSTDFVTNLVGGMRLGCPTHASSELFDLMINCWHIKPNERPCFAEINQLIRDMINKC